MMFQGSENVGDEQHFKIVSESGGTLNGSTNTDRTNYFETVPSNQLQKMLWLEADRMGFLLDAVTQEKFEVQRETVKNERGQRMDNRPYGLLIERVNEALYPEGHPYSWHTIGYLQDIDRVDVNDLKKFFLRWYGPNNAALTIGGEFDEAETLAWVAKYFGSIPRGPDVAMPEKPVVTLEADRYISLEDNVALPLLYMAYPTVYLHHPDEAPLDVLMSILGQGETSLLYKNMVKNGLAVQAGAGHGCQELSCTFTIVALPNPAMGKTLADIHAPRGPDVAMPEKPVVTLEADRYISLEDNVALPLLYMAYPTVYLHHPDEAPLDVLMSILGQGETSLLYKNMVKNGLAVQAGAGHGCQELSCTFTIVALPNPAMGKTLADLEQITRDSLVEFEGRGVTDDDVLRVKMSIVSGMIYGLESVAGKVSLLAAYQTYTGKPDFTAEDIARYDNVTKEDVMRVYRQYISGKSAVIMSVVPHGQLDGVAGADTWSRYERALPDYAATNESDLDYRRAKDDFDRKVMPPAGANPSVTLPKIWRDELKNGVQVLGAVNEETPTTAISLRIQAGQRNESLDQLGLASLTAAMMNEATQRSTNEELSDRLQKLGSTIQFGADNNKTVMSIRSLSKNLDATLAIAAEKLLEPKFDESDFERVKSQTLQAIERSSKEAASTAEVVYQQLLLGKNNSIAYLNIGSGETVRELTLADVKKFHAEHYSPRIASIIGVSNFAKPALLEKLAVFQSWEGPDVEAVELQSFPHTGGTKIYLVDKPGAAQSEIRIGKRSLSSSFVDRCVASTIVAPKMISTVK